MVIFPPHSTLYSIQTVKAASLMHVICATQFALINDYYLNNGPHCMQSFTGHFVSQGYRVVIKKLNLQLVMCCKRICLHFRADPVDGGRTVSPASWYPPSLLHSGTSHTISLWVLHNTTWKWRQEFPPKRLYPPLRHGVTTHKTNIKDYRLASDKYKSPKPNQP
jgi:hypothetical protein